MKAIALAALAMSALASPALAGPYVESKHEFKGTDDDYSKAVHQGRVGYEWKTGRFSSIAEKEVLSPAPTLVIGDAILSVAFIASFSYFDTDKSA